MPNNKRPNRGEEVFSTISHLFNEKGYMETTMRGIAKRLNIKAPSLYNYVNSKEEALFKVLNDSMDLGLKKMQDVCEMRISPKEKLYKLIDIHIQPYSVKREGPVLLMKYIDKLTKEHQKILITKQRHFADLGATILQELQEKGRAKKIPAKIALFILLGMVTYTVKWYDKNGPVTPYELNKYIADVFTKGILK
jgi:AcrR family transcriptional regulator